MSLRTDGVAGPRPFDRVLIANRGEIAVRIIRACRELGLGAVAVYSDADEGAPHVRAADEAIRIGPAPALESYLRGDAIVEAALAVRAGAIHPGYGFLAERASFAAAVEVAGIVFVGPSAATIEALGDKLAARRLARDAGVPVVPGTLDAVAVERADEIEAVLAEATTVGLPLLVKAAAGGGGRGMRRVTRLEDLPAALAAGSAEAASAFGDGRVYLEREIRGARHIEVQLIGDGHGEVMAVGDRDCSLQRRHQKLVEEAPAPGLSSDERTALLDHATRLGQAAGLVSAATAEFLLDDERRFWFLEVNTRLQVEHGVTELLAEVDLVREQLEIAAGRPLSDAVRSAAAAASRPVRHAIEVRLSAEDPARAFAPAPGRIGRWSMPSGPGVRVDAGVEAGSRVPPDYDPLVAKLLVVDVDRDAAIDRLARALAEVEVSGIQTTLPFHRFVAGDPSFRAGDVSIDWVERHWTPVAEADCRSALADAESVAALVAGVGSGAMARGGVVAKAASPTVRAAPATAVGDGGLSLRKDDDSAARGWRRDGRVRAVRRWPS